MRGSAKTTWGEAPKSTWGENSPQNWKNISSRVPPTPCTVNDTCTTVTPLSKIDFFFSDFFMNYSVLTVLKVLSIFVAKNSTFLVHRSVLRPSLGYCVYKKANVWSHLAYNDLFSVVEGDLVLNIVTWGSHIPSTERPHHNLIRI